MTHSAASQSAAQMARHGLLTIERGADARQRIARLTKRARALLPLIEAEWAATDAAAAELEAELPAALTQVLQAAERAVLSRPMRRRIADAARTLAGEAAPSRSRRTARHRGRGQLKLTRLLPDFGPARAGSPCCSPGPGRPDRRRLGPEDLLRGRVSSVEYIIGTGGPLGNVESGTVASLTTPAVSAVSGGLGCLAIAALIGLLYPAFTHYQGRPAGSRDSLITGGAMDVEVTDNPDKARFEIVADGELAGFAQYHLRDAEIAFTHTQTNDRFRGYGLGGRLVQASLDEARARRLLVLPYCPFVNSWIASHREYADLVPDGRREQFGL